MTAAAPSSEYGIGAVVVIDMQNDYCHPDGVFAQAGLVVRDLPALVDRINTLVSAARAAQVPVIWVRMEWADDSELGILAQRSPFLAAAGLRTGTWGSELVAGLDVRSEDPVVVKQRFSAFYRTSLAETLAGVAGMAVAGVRTDFCVESTVRDAFFRDLEVVVARDAVAGYFPDLHENSLRVMGTVFARIESVDALVTRFEAVRGCPSSK
ncbi:cysteine hydrolase family protein [Nocardia grenadensis]|uniref:cysteine hydrolase family protein n=1 Tax=Nocardia grenadensis TaxID=931537 RepID=UPI003D932FFE